MTRPMTAAEFLAYEPADRRRMMRSTGRIELPEGSVCDGCNEDRLVYALEDTVQLCFECSPPHVDENGEVVEKDDDDE